MKKIAVVTLLALTMILPVGGQAQSYPKNYFRSPVDFPINLAGSFGEVRKNHFHSGIDIRTDGVTGKPIRAIADGYVTRVFISSGGFGKALYVMHSNGYSSVYGHLQGFNTAVGGWVKSQQYKQESFDLDMSVEKGVLPVKKGEIIAYSGNSGSSGGPHLHFEIRDAATQEVINPLLFGMPMTDNVDPKINRVKVYPYGENSLVNFTNNPASLDITGSYGNYFVKSKDTVRVSGNIIFGIDATDFMSESGLKNGVNSIELSVDGEQRFFQHIERFAFAETRYVNSVIDYPSFIRSGQKVQRSYIAPNNKLSIFSKLNSNGVVSFTDNKAHKVEYVVKDVFGNTSKCSFWVKSHLPIQGGRPRPKMVSGTFFNCKSENQFSANNILFELPDNAIYEDLDFQYSTSSPVRGSLSKVHHLQDQYTPIQSMCTLSIKPEVLPERLKSKVVIVKVEDSGSFSSKGGKLENGWVKTQIREFGKYAVAADTTPPVIRAVNIAPGKKLTKQRTISMKITDNLSGVKSYRGTLNGKWILMDFDAKSSSLVYTFDDRIRPGKIDFKLVVKDGVGNEATYSAKLIK
jgi:hypothetical protein